MTCNFFKINPPTLMALKVTLQQFFITALEPGDGGFNFVLVGKRRVSRLVFNSCLKNLNSIHNVRFCSHLCLRKFTRLKSHATQRYIVLQLCVFNDKENT